MKTALILSGGGAKGSIEIGACKAILKKTIPNVIIGTSVGALNGAVLADGPDINENLKKLEQGWLKIKKRNIFSLNKEIFYKFHHAKSIYSNKNFYKYVKKSLKARKIEELSIPTYINCTNLITGKSEFFSKGNLADAIIASCSASIIFPPVKINNKPYVDGALSSVLGIQKAIDLGCKKVIIIDIETSNENIEYKSLPDYAVRSWALVREQNIKNEIEICKNKKIKVINIKTANPRINIISTDFKKTKEYIKFGETETNKILKKIKKI